MAQLAAESPDERDRRLTRAAWTLLQQMPDDRDEFLALSQRWWEIARRDLKIPLPAWPFTESERGPDGSGPYPSNVTPLRRGPIIAGAIVLAVALQLGDTPRNGLVQACCKAEVKPIGIDPVVRR